MNVTKATLVLCLFMTATLSSAQDFETPPILSAGDLVPQDALRGERHRLDDEVRNDGLMNHFVIRSDFGVFEAGSEAMLAIRLREVHALARLEEIKRSDVFADALVAAAMKPVDAAKNLVTDPVGTAKKVPGGVGRAFKGLYYKGRKTAHKIGDEIDELKDDEKDDAPSEDDGMTAAELADEGEKAAKSYLGFNSALRDLSRRLQVDPYSSNPVLRAELEKLANAAFASPPMPSEPWPPSGPSSG